MNPHTTACIIQARLGSTRLPAKVLLPLPTGRTVLEEVICRCLQIKGVDVVVVAVADDDGSDILLPFIEKARSLSRPVSIRQTHGDIEYKMGIASPDVKIVRGPEHDVLKRYVMAAEEVNADVIMRVTADCPLIDPSVCSGVLSFFQENQPMDYCSNVHPRSFPVGLDCEVFARGALDWADGSRHFGPFAPCNPDAEWREHVTMAICKTPSVFRIGNHGAAEDQSHIRLTLDTIEDYQAIWNEFEYEKTVREWQDAPRVGREMI